MVLIADSTNKQKKIVIYFNSIFIQPILYMNSWIPIILTTLKPTINRRLRGLKNAKTQGA